MQIYVDVYLHIGKKNVRTQNTLKNCVITTPLIKKRFL